MKPAKGKRFGKRFAKYVTNPKTERKRKARDSSDRIKPGTSRGDAYRARSNKSRKQDD